MAHELGLALNDYLRKTTHRQHLVWLAFLEERMEHPDAVYKFRRVSDDKKPSKELVEANKRRWMSIVGMPDKEETLGEPMPGVDAVNKMREAKIKRGR